MRWYVESDNNFEKELTKLSIDEKNKKIAELVRHKSNGEKCSDLCATKNCESYIVLDWKDFYGKKPIYMSVDNIKK
tara:strand:- start:587 stop:814 length:228 start_codon:yes stop_codon:yes gene_type:complete